MKRILLFLVYSFASAGVFTFLEKQQEINKEKAMKESNENITTAEKKFTIHHDITDLQ